MGPGKVYPSAESALSGVSDEATVLVAGFAGAGAPRRLLQALADSGIGRLTCVCSADSTGGVARLVANGQVRKLISPLPWLPGPGGVIEERWQSGELEVEVVPMGVLAERLRAGGAGIGGVFLPDAVGTRFAAGREKRTFGNREALLELPLKADLALIKAAVADTLGNLIYQSVGRNWGPVMAMAAKLTIAEADQVVPPGGLNPEAVITPGIFVNRVVASG